MSKEKDPRLIVNESLCFVCQREEPSWLVTKNDKESFKLCEKCKGIVLSQNATERAVESALLYPENGFQVFSLTLGMKSSVPWLNYQRIESAKATSTPQPASAEERQ